MLPALLVHGTALGAITFRGLNRRLRARGLETVAFDRLGYDGTPVPDDRYSLQAEVDHLLAGARAAFGDQSFQIVGHSLGGLLSLHVARTTKQVAKVTLLDPVASRLLFENDEAAGYADMSETYQAVLQAPDDEAAIAGFIHRWSGPNAWNSMAPLAKKAAISLVPRMRQELVATRHHDRATADLLDFKAPIHIVVGAATREPPKAVARTLVRLRNATVSVLPGAGHLLPISHPDAVADEIVNGASIRPSDAGEANHRG
jgi:pimeloyl-ACP methyl ester carboxylesterase